MPELEHDWRLTVRFERPEQAHSIFSSLKTHESAALVADPAKEGLLAERDGEWLRLYGGSYEALQRAQAIVAEVLEREGVEAEERAERRSGSAAWEEVELPPPPERDADSVHEHHGRGLWGSEAEPGRVQAHFECPDTHSAQAFAKTLEADGYDVHQTGSFLFIFADDAEAAHRLGEALKRDAPAGAQLFFEGEARTFFV